MSIKGGNMKVIESEEGYLKFDNGLILESDHRQSCCEINYLDFEEQLPVGTELPTMTAKEFAEAIKIGDDGDIIRYWERKGNGWLEFKTAAEARKKYNEIKKIIEG